MRRQLPRCGLLLMKLPCGHVNHLMCDMHKVGGKQHRWQPAMLMLRMLTAGSKWRCSGAASSDRAASSRHTSSRYGCMDSLCG